MKLEIRPAQAVDAPAIVGLLRQLGYPDTEPFIERRMTQAMEHPDALLLVATVAGVVVGMMSLHFIPQLARAADFCRISFLCVEHRVRSLGVGAALEARAVEAARQRGCVRIELHSHARRADAHRFYARQGYEESPKYLVKQLG